MRILITASSGQLGAEIARQLSSEHQIIGLDLLPGAWTNQIGSVTDRDLVFALAKEADAIIHTASLHARHLLEGVSKQAFINTNISGTLHLLEAAIQAGIRRFVYTSTTSVYGFALVPTDRAVWVTEDLTPRPRDIYDITKLAAEELCRHFALAQGLPVICLRTARFYSEPPERLGAYRLYRGVDVRDAAAAHALAVANQEIAFDLFNIAARSPLQEADTPALWRIAPTILSQRVPGIAELYAARGWSLPERIDRVYVIARAEQRLGYRPRHNFREYMQSL
ncbi:MAG TPA: NAD(P)-dependent oxidoreductase [Ktedonobacterales bacterium]